MSHALSSAASYLASLWKPEHSETGSAFSRQSDPVQLATTQSATRALNQQISDLLPGCTLRKAMLRETKQGELSFHSEAGETMGFSDEKTMNQWLADKATVDIWQVEDQRAGRSGVFYKLQRTDAYGYDTFETRDELFDQLREDYGVFWKLEDQGKNQISYIHFKTGLFGSHYVDANHEDLIFVTNNLKLEGSSLPTSTSHASDRTSWGKGIAACVLGGLLLSAGRSWSQSPGQNPVSDAITMMKGALGPAVFKAASTFAAIAAVSRQEGGVLPGVLFAGMMLLPEPVKGQSLCPQLVGSYNTPGRAWGIAVSGNYAYVADFASGLQIIDVSNVTDPTFAGSYDTPSNVHGVAASGNYAYVADWGSGLHILDVSNVTNPLLAGSYDTPDLAEDVAISGNYAYVADAYSGLQIIDVSNKANPTLAGSYNTPGYAYGVAVSGNYAYVADHLSGLHIIDVSNKANPTLAGSYDTPDLGFDVIISGNYAFVADRFSGLQVINVSNKTNPLLAGSYDTPDYAWDIAVFGNYAYVADRASLQIIDVSNVSNPSFAGSYPTGGQAHGIAVSGNYVYVADDPSGLQIISIFCPTSSSSTSSSTSSSSSSTTLSSSTTSTQTSCSTTTSSSSKTSSSSTIGLTTKSTTMEDTSTPVSNGTPWLWIGLLGGGLCICLIGGTAFILRRRQKSPNVELEPIEGDMRAHARATHESEYKMASDVLSYEDEYRKTPDHVSYEDAYQKTPDVVTNKTN